MQGKCQVVLFPRIFYTGFCHTVQTWLCSNSWIIPYIKYVSCLCLNAWNVSDIKHIFPLHDYKDLCHVSHISDVYFIVIRFINIIKTMRAYLKIEKYQLHIDMISKWRYVPWRRIQMETFSALLVLCVGISPDTGEFPSQWPVTRSFGVFFDLRLNKRFSKRSRRRWYETPSC